LTSGASIWVRRVDTVWRRKIGIRMIRMMIVIRTIAIAMLWVSRSRTTRRMKKAWKIGVKTHDRKLNGSVSLTGSRGIAAGGVGVAPGAPLAPGEPTGPPAQAATRRATATIARSGRSRARLERRRGSVT
jgi:hypothetical protein